jgi:hypothetical protein
MSQIVTVLDDLRRYVEENGFQGYDPFDALNSPLLKALGGRNKYLKIAFIQALKRCPVNFRPLLGIKKGHNPKGLGLFLWGYARFYKASQDPMVLEKIKALLGLLERMKSPGYSGNCWGYNFDWQNRGFFLPRFTPTIVNSAFIGHALLDTYKHTRLEKALEMAVPIKQFILNDLARTKEGSSFCFSYTPVDSSAVHNANLLGASLLIRLSAVTGEASLRDVALSSLAYSLKHQNEDGSWPYGAVKMQNWIDSFHTGFNLQSLHYFIEEGADRECRNAFERGVRFFEDRFFLEDGTPKYYHDRTYPVDIHSAAQAIVCFSLFKPRDESLPERVLTWMISHLRGPQGAFFYQKGRWLTNRISYMRWSQAWAFHALTSWLLEHD